ncbi:hypothetical protein NLG97_g1680 [Lecanicillium saksenae]|uniref:Uncharacterized protein n=1 Tax=Lecanicillium saksenae TaxID=468837 RepID=A0ACC1R335_9HYPO|nr:hypothetical protein NLG97_g1680 [Lecanicillium saksenae]
MSPSTTEPASSLASSLSKLSISNEPQINIAALPCEILILIFEKLPLLNQYALLKVCSAIRTKLRGHFYKGTLSRATAGERLEYLVQRAYHLPEYWVCEKCLDLHWDHPDDVPIAPKGCLRRHGHFRSPLFQIHGQSLSHRHVQLALKYTRMSAQSTQYAERLDRLMEEIEYFNDGSEPVRLPPAHYPGQGYHWWTPKIAPVEGRFLLYQGMHFVPLMQGGWQLSNMPTIILCQHCLWLKPTVERIEVLRSLAHLTVEQAAELPRLLRIDRNPLQQAIRRLIQDGGGELTLSCPDCASDCQVTTVETGKMIWVEYQAWHDFGAEGSPLDPHWIAKEFPLRQSEVAPRTIVEPGNARRLWEDSQGLDSLKKAYADNYAMNS